jgi:integrase
MATLSTRRGYHILAWTDPGTKKRKRISLGKVGTIPKRDLDDLLRIKDYELSTGARLLHAHRRPAPRFSEFVTGYLLWHRAEFPTSHYRTGQIVDDHLLGHFGTTPLNLISIEQAESFKTKRRFLVRASTVGKELRVLHAILNRAVTLKVISDNPISAVKAPKILDSAPHRWFSAEELAKLYAQSKYGPIWKLMANTGLRRTEGLILRWLWITEKTIRILSTGEERTKDAEWREIPRTAGTAEALAAMKQDGPYVLPRMRKESLSRAFLRDARAAGLDGSLHTLRHTFVCHMLLAGVPIRTVQLYAGHAHLSTTETYAYQVLRQDPDAALALAI